MGYYYKGCGRQCAGRLLEVNTFIFFPSIIFQELRKDAEHRQDIIDYSPAPLIPLPLCKMWANAAHEGILDKEGYDASHAIHTPLGRGLLQNVQQL